MRRRSHALCGAAAIGFALLQAAPAHADGPLLVPPQLTESAAAEDPRVGAAPRVVVEPELDIDRDGEVGDARVIRSGGEAVDAAALTAARTFHFAPATRDGKPTAARIRYESVFEARDLAAAPASNPPIAQASSPSTAPASSAQAAPVAEDPQAFGATARVEAPPREATKRTLERTELASIAGTRGDALRGVELLPGVSRPAPNGGLPILRGANPYDSQVFMDGAPVPFLYHVGGLTSFVHARALDSVELYPGNFSVRFGRKMGGVIEAKLRDPRTDGLHGIADLSLLDSSLLVETPISSQLSVLAAGRRSNIDAVISSASGDANIGVVAAPVYWDYQSIATFKPTERDRIRLLAYGSSDSLALVFKKPADADPSMRGAFDDHYVFHHVQLGYRHRFDGGSEVNTELTYGREDGVGHFGKIGRYEFEVNKVQVRSEWTQVIAPELRVTGGVDVFANHFAAHYRGIPLPADEGDRPMVLSAQKRISIDPSAWSTSSGAYLEAGIRPVPNLLITPGLRADYNDFVKRGSLDPRLSARFDVTETTALKAGIGKFTQIPSEAEVISPTGNPNLRLPRALHVSAGVEHKVTDSFTASAEGFAKWMDQITTTTPGGSAPFFVNAQRGRVYGVEVLLRVQPAGRFFGFLSYTLMRSERATQGEPMRLFERDQTHIVSATGVYRLGRGWEIGGTLRYTSGTPFTPVIASTFDAANDVYLPRLGRPMSERNPAFARVDARVQKTWTFSRWSLSAYLDVQNVLNAENREGFAYSYDYRSRDGIRGLPILPIVGVRGEL